jgi:hypothetical protein
MISPGYNILKDKLFSEEYLAEKRKKEDEFLKSLDISEELQKLIEKEREEKDAESRKQDNEDNETEADMIDDSRSFKMYIVVTSGTTSTGRTRERWCRPKSICLARRRRRS